MFVSVWPTLKVRLLPSWKVIEDMSCRDSFAAAEKVIGEHRGEQFFRGENDRAFARRVFTTDPFDYMAVVRQISFNGLGSVLDAGCGFGQWSLALAETNESVVALDVSHERVRFLSEVLENSGTSNVQTWVADLSRTGLLANEFDGVFSYGVVFCTPWRQTLREFHRILRPGGSLYFNATSFDWFAFLWQTRHNECSDYKPRSVVANALMNTLLYEDGDLAWSGQIVMTPDETVSFLEANGFRDVEWKWQESLASRDGRSLQGVDASRGLFEVRATKASAPGRHIFA